jgi:hypothetical protein
MLWRLAGSSAPDGRVSSPASRSPSGPGPEEDPLVSTFVIVPGAWDTPATTEPVLGPPVSAGHEAIVVDLPCGSEDTLLAASR